MLNEGVMCADDAADELLPMLALFRFSRIFLAKGVSCVLAAGAAAVKVGDLRRLDEDLDSVPRIFDFILDLVLLLTF